MFGAYTLYIYTCYFKINFGKKLINDGSNLMNKIVTRLKHNIKACRDPILILLFIYN